MRLFFTDDRMMRVEWVMNYTPSGKIFFEFIFDDPSLNLISSEYNTSSVDTEQFKINLMIDVAKEEFNLVPIYI
jgi:hypothetical protein